MARKCDVCGVEFKGNAKVYAYLTSDGGRIVVHDECRKPEWDRQVADHTRAVLNQVTLGLTLEEK